MVFGSGMTVLHCIDFLAKKLILKYLGLSVNQKIMSYQLGCDEQSQIACCIVLKKIHIWKMIFRNRKLTSDSNSLQ